MTKDKAIWMLSSWVEPFFDKQKGTDGEGGEGDSYVTIHFLLYQNQNYSHTVVHVMLLVEYLTAPRGSEGFDTFRDCGHEAVLPTGSFMGKSLSKVSRDSSEKSLHCLAMVISSSLELRAILGAMVTSSIALRVRGGSRNCPIREIVDILYNEVFSCVLLGDGV